MQDVLLIQFAREPVPGQVKTRMLPELNPEQACELHRELVLWTTRVLTRAAVGDVELSVVGNAGSPLFQQCCALGVKGVRGQRGRDLGERMYRSMDAGLENYSKVILVGSDVPQLDAQYLEQAVVALDDVDVVLGPAADGGYVLIGARRLERAWFEGVAWGSETVFEDTVRQFQATSTDWCALSVLQDIDRPEDLPLWRALAGEAG